MRRASSRSVGGSPRRASFATDEAGRVREADAGLRWVLLRRPPWGRGYAAAFVDGDRLGAGAGAPSAASGRELPDLPSDLWGSVIGGWGERSAGGTCPPASSARNSNAAFTRRLTARESLSLSLAKIELMCFS